MYKSKGGDEDDDDEEDKEVDASTTASVDFEPNRPEDMNEKWPNGAPGDLMDATDKEAVDTFEKGKCQYYGNDGKLYKGWRYSIVIYLLPEVDLFEFLCVGVADVYTIFFLIF